MFNAIDIRPWQAKVLVKAIIAIALLLTVIGSLLVYLTSINIALPALILITVVGAYQVVRLRQLASIRIQPSECVLTLNSGESIPCKISQDSKLYPQFIDLKLVSLCGQKSWWCPVFEEALDPEALSSLRLYLQGYLK